MDQFQALLDQASVQANLKLEEKVANLLKKHNHTIAVAESLTGGLISSRLTRLPKSSDFFVGGIVAYHTIVKVQQVGVDPKVIAKHGVVSEETAMAMAEGVRNRLKADIGLSATGVAGPDPLPGVPVGLVWIGMSVAGEKKAKKFMFEGMREDIRQKASQAALGMIWIHYGELII
ncbi:MAG: CinA family protein [Candidatus Margulisbacteria bacterium]|nr:CinA family protein [Candidatus Margulisiibacteriota bacterium]